MTLATSHLWYPTAAALPPRGVPVRVLWENKHGFTTPFEAASALHPKTRELLWLTHHRGNPVWLPAVAHRRTEDVAWQGWHQLKGDDPKYWQPLNPAKWALRLPDPVDLSGPHHDAHLWNSRQSFDAAEAAREMEAWRDEARAGGPRLERDEIADLQWWLTGRVTYSPPGQITLHEAEGRLMRAFLTERWVRVDRPVCKTFGGVLAKMIKPDPLSARELAAIDPEPMRIEPERRDWDDMEQALRWALAAGGKEARPHRALRARAETPALSWRGIARRLNGTSATAKAVTSATAKAVYDLALAEVTAAANGRETDEVAAVRAAHAATRARLANLNEQRKQRRERARA